MPHLHHSNSFRAIALLSMAAMLLSACTTWQPIFLEPGAVPDQVRITTESERFVFKNARLVGDTAIVSTGTWDITTPLRSVRVIDIQVLERKKISIGRTMGLTGGILAVAFVAIVALSFESPGLGNWCGR